jgi:hypothetical protein
MGGALTSPPLRKEHSSSFLTAPSTAFQHTTI